MTPRPTRDEHPSTVTTSDGVRLRTVHLAAQLTEPSPRDVAVVLVPGFSCSWEKPFVRRVARWLTPYAGVVVVDLRGQGRSGGRSTLGDREALDVDAAVGHARRLGYRRVVTLGFSMGGAAVLRHAGLLGELTTCPVDAVVSVSAASGWWQVETRRMRRLARLATTRSGRLVARLVLRTRIDGSADYGSAASPEQVVGSIAPTPLLLVHGEQDGYLGPGNAVALRTAAAQPAELWVWSEYGHAELALDEPHTARIGGHLRTLLGRSAAAGGADRDATMGTP